MHDDPEAIGGMHESPERGMLVASALVCVVYGVGTMETTLSLWERAWGGRGKKFVSLRDLVNNCLRRE